MLSPRMAGRDSSGKLKFSSSQPTLSYRVFVFVIVIVIIFIIVIPRMPKEKKRSPAASLLVLCTAVLFDSDVLLYLRALLRLLARQLDV